MMKQSVVWSSQMLTLQQRANSCEMYIANSPEGRRDATLSRCFEAWSGARRRAAPSQVAQQVGRGGGHTAAAAGVAAAQAVNDGTEGAPEIRDPNELYTEAVKNALIDAMLRYSGH